jgi:poly(3-hydroxybutyrate) depolymerase
MSAKQRDYGTANFVLSVLIILAWAQILIGALIFLTGLSGGGSRADSFFNAGLAAFGFIVIISGLLNLAFNQMARASIHTAEINWEMLQIMRSQHGVANASPQSATGSTVSYRTFEEATTRPNSEGPVFVSDRMGKKREVFRLQDGKFAVKTITGEVKAFATMDEVRAYLS